MPWEDRIGFDLNDRQLQDKAVIRTNYIGVFCYPIAEGKTRARTWTLSDRGATDTPEAKAEIKRDQDFNAIGLREDQDMVGSIQRGLASDANSHLTFGKYEKLISHLHRNLQEVLSSASVYIKHSET